MRIGFADEFGNNSFEFETQGSHFIVACILVKDAEQVSVLENQAENIRKKHFQTGEIKSNKVATNHTRRIKILQELIELEFSIFAVVIDKRDLFGQGFKYKKSFYKFTNNLLYKELFRTFPELELNVDEHGTNNFMLEFRKYVEKNHQRTLFSGIEFNQINSSSSIIIQIADFIAGTIGYIFDESKESEYSQEFYNLIKPKISVLNNFPRKLTVAEFNESAVDQTYDSRIAEVSFQRIFDFIEKGSNGETQINDQITFLKLLLWLQRANPRSSYVSTGEIMRHLNYTRDKPMNEEFFRSKIIGNLRDKGIIISSSPKGYKIPTSSRDIDSFGRHGNRIILPMLNRINEARNAIKLISLNELDILENPIYSDLKNLLDK
ncbi:DUF3800 domain-containing protein [Flavobacterium silvaticum]|uniref:DUF3800 domain-containing protein n=1 Tax=Flavobacterium silvaticum TaxID=1852020 RepID=A0A972FQE9_9FLAO|nr:DUF3800 domain-containing protein [Flavobacterium silvaticum]NMH26558.1 DUF3800 domain-containing protein [Flavobacterium silvaticum]